VISEQMVAYNMYDGVVSAETKGSWSGTKVHGENIDEST
jgi:hypothetical protein